MIRVQYILKFKYLLSNSFIGKAFVTLRYVYSK